MKSIKKYFILLFLLLFIFTPFSCKKDLLQLVPVTTGTYTDTRDGRTYKTTTIGDYTWLAENLDFKTDSGSCYYDNDSVTNNKYGRLYTWKAAQAAAPPGWHVPTATELKYLYDNLGGRDARDQMMEGHNNYSELSIKLGGEFNATSSQFRLKGQVARFWQVEQYFWGIDYGFSYDCFNYFSLDSRYSVRCVRNY